MSEYLEVLDKYISTLISKLSRESAVAKLGYKEKISIYKDIEGLVAKTFESDKNSPIFKEILISKIIPYLSRFLKLDDNVVSIEKGLETLKNLYRMAGSISLKHFIIYYEWDWGDKFLEPRLNILSGYCHYLEKLVLEEDFLNVIAELPSGYRQMYKVGHRGNDRKWYKANKRHKSRRHGMEHE